MKSKFIKRQESIKLAMKNALTGCANFEESRGEKRKGCDDYLESGFYIPYMLFHTKTNFLFCGVLRLLPVYQLTHQVIPW